MLVVCVASAVGLLTGCQISPPVSEVWIGTEERELEVVVDTCNREPEVTAVETAEEVRLRTRVAPSFAFATNDCADGATVILEEPLGNRQVVDDSTGAHLDVKRAG